MAVLQFFPLSPRRLQHLRLLHPAPRPGQRLEETMGFPWKCLHPRVGQNIACLRWPPETAWATADLLLFLWPCGHLLADSEEGIRLLPKDPQE
ncbi:hypothetical protein C4D60_Mb04t37440 [Musa balbisiana]|uniref:Uncharacterized protein n=1 Tax=Musa balbisiana TaxID=52838 RepID=A0A4S8KHH1_MUSBA|nr:hypothetical protein C4D60_Mb04t37440 [Musa balbisiana]